MALLNVIRVMKIILNKITEEPQIYAAVITAIFGVLGIIINIVINLWFRYKDYKYKNHMQQLEILEMYYNPLKEKIVDLKNCISFFGDDEKMLDVILGKNGAKQAAAVERLKKSLDECKVFFTTENFKYPCDYKLFLAYKRAKETIMNLCRFRENTQVINEELTKKTMQSHLDDLIYRIQQYEYGIVLNNLFVRYKEKIKLWNINRTPRKTNIGTREDN